MSARGGNRRVAPPAVAPAPCVEGACPASGTCADGVLLQRTGARPLRVTGIVLACLDDSCRPAWSRIRLALYRCDDGDHVAEMRCEQGAGDGLIRPWCAASRHPTRAAALQALEAASPAPERVDVGSPAGRLHDAITQFRQHAAQVHAFRHAGGTFLHALATRDEADWPR